MNKRAFFLTFISVLMISFFILVFSTNLSVKVPEAKDTSWAKVDTIDRFTRDAKSVYLEKALKASSIAAFRSMAAYMAANPTKNMTNITANFTELVLYGTLGGVTQQGMVNNTLTNWSARISNLSFEHMRIRSNITYGRFRLVQTDPWVVTVHAEVFLRTTNKGVSYRIDETMPVNISIVGLQDPLHAKNGQLRIVRPTNITVWTIENGRTHMENGWYRRNPDNRAPSYLMRFSNNLSNSSCCGIESFVNSTIGPFNRSYIDYRFWNASPELCLIAPNMYPAFVVPGISETAIGGFGNFRLDIGVLADYDWQNFSIGMANNRCYP